MREIDFLPEWYKEGKRHQIHMRRQYVALAVIFISMVGYNLISTHKIARAAAELTRFEEDRGKAESAFHQFNMVTKELNETRVKADLIGRIDSKIDLGAVLAEMSHIIGETIVLKQVEFAAELLATPDSTLPPSGTFVRVADPAAASKKMMLGDVCFRILLSGLAVSPADVAALVCRLDDSSYFDRVHASYWRSATIRVSPKAPPDGLGSQTETPPTPQPQTINVTEFEVICYLANYRESSN